jgi:hypothetical protein
MKKKIDRNEVLRMYNSGMKQCDIVEKFSCAKSTISQIINPKKPKEILTQQMLKDILRYDENTGFFYHRRIRKGVTEVNQKAGVVDNGYVKIRINGKSYRAHRLVWLYTYGEFPKDQIDHINHDRSDNRIINLRVVNNAENSRNKVMLDSNTSGVTGVYLDKNRMKWCAHIGIDGKKKHIGYYGNFDDAVEARKKAEKKYKFHENHGK